MNNNKNNALENQDPPPSDDGWIDELLEIHDRITEESRERNQAESIVARNILKQLRVAYDATMKHPRSGSHEWVIMWLNEKLDLLDVQVLTDAEAPLVVVECLNMAYEISLKHHGGDHHQAVGFLKTKLKLMDSLKVLDAFRKKYSFQ